LFVKNGGVVLDVLSSVIYEKSDYVFSEFIDYFNNIKLQGGYYKIFAKLMINSFYGSTALKDQNEIIYITFSESEYYYILKNLTVIRFYKINFTYILIILDDYKISKSKKKISVKNLSENKSKRNVSYAAAITSKARIRLYTALTSVIKDGGRLLYCDTDSIFAAYDKNDKRIEFGHLE
jgi:hypothetical protein